VLSTSLKSTPVLRSMQTRCLTKLKIILYSENVVGGMASGGQNASPGTCFVHRTVIHQRCLQFLFVGGLERLEPNLVRTKR